MFRKFKILPVIALGICWMVMGDDAHSNNDKCTQALKTCQDRKGKAKDGVDWWACEPYKDFSVQGQKTGGVGKACFACCAGRLAPLPGDITVGSCPTANCDLAHQECPGDQFRR